MQSLIAHVDEKVNDRPSSMKVAESSHKQNNDGTVLDKLDTKKQMSKAVDNLNVGSESEEKEEKVVEQKPKALYFRKEYGNFAS